MIFRRNLCLLTIVDVVFIYLLDYEIGREMPDYHCAVVCSWNEDFGVDGSVEGEDRLFRMRILLFNQFLLFPNIQIAIRAWSYSILPNKNNTIKDNWFNLNFLTLLPRAQLIMIFHQYIIAIIPLSHIVNSTADNLKLLINPKANIIDIWLPMEIMHCKNSPCEDINKQ